MLSLMIGIGFTDLLTLLVLCLVIFFLVWFTLGKLMKTSSRRTIFVISLVSVPVVFFLLLAAFAFIAMWANG
jgi:hypothetical protein